MALGQVRLSELVEDQRIYPRGSVSMVHVADLLLALDAGNTLPAPVVDRRTRKIVDGFHRIRAQRKRLGEDGIIDVEFEDYAGDAEMFIASVEYNAPHGLRLSRYDQRVTIIKARALGLDDDTTATALGVTPVRISAITILQANSDAGPVPLKQGVGHLGGRYLTSEQLAEIRKMRGGRTRDKVTELDRMLQTEGLVPLAQDPALRQSLAGLALTIAEVLAPYAAADLDAGSEAV